MNNWTSPAEDSLSQLEPRTQLTPEEEMAFRLWWRANAPMHGQGEHPVTRGHFYDYRGAWQAGQGPMQQQLHWKSGLMPEEDQEYQRPHWTSAYKSRLSPERYLLGQSGRVYDSLRDDPEEPYGYLIED